MKTGVSLALMLLLCACCVATAQAEASQQFNITLPKGWSGGVYKQQRSGATIFAFCPGDALSTDCVMVKQGTKEAFDVDSMIEFAATECDRAQGGKNLSCKGGECRFVSDDMTYRVLQSKNYIIEAMYGSKSKQARPVAESVRAR